MAFAYYEGCGGTACCGEILAEAAPLALGKELVANHGFGWAMIASGDTWRYGVVHPALDGPIDLVLLEDGSWNDEEYDLPPSPGKRTHDSLETIVERVRRIREGPDLTLQQTPAASRSARYTEAYLPGSRPHAIWSTPQLAGRFSCRSGV